MKRQRASNGTGERIFICSIQQFDRRAGGGAYVTATVQSSGGRMRKMRLEFERFELMELAKRQADALRARSDAADNDRKEFVSAVIRNAAEKTP